MSQPAASPFPFLLQPHKASKGPWQSRTAVLMIHQSYEVIDWLGNSGYKGIIRDEGRGWRCKAPPPDALPLIWTCLQATAQNSAACGSLPVNQRTKGSLSLLFFKLLPHHSPGIPPFLSPDIVSFLIFPLSTITTTAGPATSLGLAETQRHSAGLCAGADTVAMQPVFVFQGLCLLYFPGLKSGKKTAAPRRARAVN